MAEVALAFLWHQHQPYYPDDVGGENPMPWVRLHGVKDYYGMALHLLEYPEMRCTINLVPSLVRQLLAYAEGEATDQFLEVSRKPADGLEERDCLFLLDHFFMANHDQMIRPYPRYAELLHRRNAGRETASQALRRFQERDLRDLQVWFNLTWVHPLAFERDADLKTLLDKGRFFTEQEKNWLLDKHREILRQVIPLHQQLAASGQIELTTTPYFHPILPLLLDKKLAREAMPDVKLPRYTGGYPEDAAAQVRWAVEYHRQVFGAAPAGMWPAEGAVCQSMLPLLAEHGIRWLATDEEVLSASTQGFVSRDSRGHVRNPEMMYRPYKVAEAGHELGIVFRDHALSDLIGFHYQRSEPTAAADDFVQRLRAIGQAVHTSEPALVSVILDGENCWEHYPSGGVTFLRSLYERCTRTQGLRPVQIGAFLKEHPPRDTLPRLFAGSWIRHNFAIWIGHEEDNAAWDALHRTREYLVQRGGSAARGKETKRQGDKETKPSETEAGREGQPAARPAPDRVSVSPGLPVSLSAVERAWEEIYIAEGSDWFWWYGDEHSSAQDNVFDYLFRKHLQNVYLLLGDTPPADLSRPISRRSQKAMYTLPRGFLNVKIDGQLTFFEWISAGRYTCQNERGTMAMVTRGPIKEVHFGFDVQTLFVRVDFDGPAREALADFDALRLVFVEPPGYEVVVERPGSPKPAAKLLHHGKPVPAAGVEVGVGRIVELAVPFALLGVKVDQPIQFAVDLLEGRQSVDRAPREGVIGLFCPSPDFEQIMWDV
ncbi:MAG TPA: glycoside hydrolase family 57 protein [Gemmataceae bacterium]|nr:glycoside hydrolase family 57 protein [Gemmataceae bacterium]